MRLWIAIIIAWPLLAQQVPAPLKLTLQEAEALAQRQHPQLAGARLITQAAGQVTRESRSVQYPQMTGALTAVGALTGSRIGAGALNAGALPDRVAGGILLQQLITDFGRTRHSIASAALREQSHGQSEEATRAGLLLEVDRSYYRSLRATALLRVAQQTTAARQVIVDQIAALTQSNLRSQLDLSFVSVNLAEAQLLETTARNELQESYADLSAALGFSAPQAFDLTDVLVGGPPDPDIDSLTRQAFVERPDLKSVRLERDSLNEFAQSERALSRPTVSAAAVVGGVPAHNTQIGDYYGAAGVNVSVPVLNGSLFAARRTEADLRAQAASQRVRDLENQIAREVRDAWLEANTSYQRIGLTNQLLQQATMALDLAQGRYDLGLSSIVELTQAQLSQTSAEIQNLTSRYDYQTEFSALRYQAGLLR